MNSEARERFLMASFVTLLMAATGAFAEPATKGLGPASCTQGFVCGWQFFGFLGSDPGCQTSTGFWANYWTFQGNAGDMVTIDAASFEFDTVLELYDPDDNFVTGNDDVDFGSTDSRIEHTLDRSGRWTVKVTNFGEGIGGMYEFALGCVADPSAPPAAPSHLTAAPVEIFGLISIELDWDDNSETEDEFRVERKKAGGRFVEIGTVEADTGGVVDGPLEPATTYTYRVRAVNANGFSAYSNEASATTFGGGCTPTDTSLCLLDGRFRVEVEWLDFNFDTGSGHVVELGSFASGDSGLFWFFDQDNWEMLVKMVDACNSPFESFWVFAAATTTVEYTLRITDTESGAVHEYVNFLGQAAPALTDTEAFRCP